MNHLHSRQSTWNVNLNKNNRMSSAVVAGTVCNSGTFYPSDILIPNAAIKTLRIVMTKIRPTVVSFNLCTCFFSSGVFASMLPSTSKIIPTITCNNMERDTRTCKKYTYEPGNSISTRLRVHPARTDQLERIRRLISLRCPPRDCLDTLVLTQCPAKTDQTAQADLSLRWTHMFGPKNTRTCQ